MQPRSRFCVSVVPVVLAVAVPVVVGGQDRSVPRGRPAAVVGSVGHHTTGNAGPGANSRLYMKDKRSHLVYPGAGCLT